MTVETSLPVLARQQGAAGIISLNRPNALHALSIEMCDLMREALTRWAADPAIEFVLIEHMPETRGFCAGGDIRMLAESGRSDGAAARAFFRSEYQLNALIKAFPKPYIAFIDGVTMGGGVGVSVHGTYRIATERTLFAMPETGIGLFPDVGGGWFLPRLRGRLGYYFGLTGARSKGADVLAAGIATHFVPSDDIAALKAAVLQEGVSALERCQKTAPFGLEPYLDEIDQCFAAASVAEIVARLEAGSDWARKQADILKTKSPLSMGVTLRQLQVCEAAENFQDAMKVEYRIGGRMVATHDFQEGVRAVIIEKDNAPVWNPVAIDAVTEEIIAPFFEPAPSGDLHFDA